VLIPVALSDFSLIDLDDAAWAATAELDTRTAVIAMREVRLMRSTTPRGVYFFRGRRKPRCHIERSPIVNASRPTGANENTVSSTGIPATWANTTKASAIMTARRRLA
jgi:hypothetical protein